MMGSALLRTVVLQPPTPAYDYRDQVELRRTLALRIQEVLAAVQATGASDALLAELASLDARVTALEVTMAAVIDAIVAYGIPFTPPAGTSADFSSADNSGLLVLRSLGGL